MGTSSSFGGKKDKKSLLPSDYNPTESDNQPEVNSEPITWKGTKSGFSQYINGNGGSGIRKTAGNYIRASGGSKSLMKNSTSGISGAVAIGGLVNSIVKNGFQNTLDNLGVTYIGKSVESILSSLVNQIVSNSNTKEDCIAREATVNALVDMYDYIEKNNLDFNHLDNVPEDFMDCVFCSYVENYIWIKILNDLEICLEKYAEDITKVVEIEREMKEYVSNVVYATFNSDGIRAKVFEYRTLEAGVQEMYLSCYCELEGY